MATLSQIGDAHVTPMVHPIVNAFLISPNFLPGEAAWETTIGSAMTGSQQIFSVTCEGPCNQVTVSISASSGNADLYANEDEPPVLSGNSCPDCSICEETTQGLIETCSNMSTKNGNRQVTTNLFHTCLNNCTKFFTASIS